MMNTLRLVARRNFHQLRNFNKGAVYGQTAETAVSPAEKLTAPPPEGTDKPVSDKIEKLVKDITALNLMEVAELSDILKKRLNLPDAPVMPMGGMMMAKPEEEEAAPQQKQSSFTVKLTGFDEKQKVPLIKEIKVLVPGMNLVQAKKFVESVPTIVKADVEKEEADKLKEAITRVGGVIEIS
ncbi:39S ribosomal protein L12, mitochondrial isoform X2 [Diachasma alloeum]|uniref:39S ribosomal protein L12, mitochondrial isoform X2 n=1 Tax=Diachasma alloeum TaxID=454923 RepID=UPI0007382DD5|nr:39S ribosomal protein L12, mitochondrial isoform X2 [Diachasma alloeum]